MAVYCQPYFILIARSIGPRASPVHNSAMAEMVVASSATAPRASEGVTSTEGELRMRFTFQLLRPVVKP